MLVYLSMIDTPEERTKFEILYNTHRETMYQTAFNILENIDDAEDAVHQAFLYIVQNMHRIDDPDCDKTKSYLSIIVESRAVDIWRFNNNHKIVSYDDAIGMTVNYSGSDDIAQCFEKLPVEYRQIILLKHRHGFSYMEIANMLHLTIFNVKKRYQRAKEKLAELCKEEGIR